MSFRETFETTFPYYLSIGMTYEQFYNDDPYLVVYYRKAEKMKQKRLNEQAWLHGMYIYDGVQTVIYNTWCRGKRKAANYPTEPYKLDGDTEIDEEKKVKEERAKAKVWLNNFVMSYKK